MLQAPSPKEAPATVDELRQLLGSRAPFLGAREGRSTGIASFDAAGGGFPKGGLTVVTGAPGVGRLRLIAQALAHETREGRAVAWVDGRGTLYPPALEAEGVGLDRLLIVRVMTERAVYAAEQIIESGAFGLVVATGLERWLQPSRVRRLQGATESADVSTLLVLDEGAPQLPAAVLKLRLERRGETTAIHIEKDRSGRLSGQSLSMPSF